MSRFGPLRTFNFYSPKRFAESVELPLYFGGEVWSPLRSLHYIDPTSGEIWFSLEIPGKDWSTLIIPSPESRARSVEHRIRGLHLDWTFGSKVYDQTNLALFPRPVLELEFQAALYNHDQGIY